MASILVVLVHTAHAHTLVLFISSLIRQHQMAMSPGVWKGHMVGTNGSVDQQEVSFQNMCTWLLLPKNTQCGV